MRAELFKPFPVDALPEILAHYVTESSKSLGVDPAFVALPVLGVGAAACGAAHVARVKSSWLEPSILWVAVVARTGTGKTPALDAAIRPYFDVEEELVSQSRASVGPPGLAACAGGDGEKPVDPCLIVGDITMESLFVRLSEHAGGLLRYSDELALLIAALDRYAQKGGGDEAHLLSLFSAKPVRVDRKGAKEPIRLAHPVMSIVGGIQPGTLASLLTDRRRESGFASRFLFSMPPELPSVWREDEISEHARNQYRDLLRRLVQRRSEALASSPKPIEIPFASEGRSKWVVPFHNKIASALEGESSESARGGLCKLKSIVPRLALLFHLVGLSSESGEETGGEISEFAAARAVEIGEWFQHEIVRVYACLDAQGAKAKDLSLVRLIESMGGNVTPNQLHKKRRSQFTDSDAARAALKRLVEMGYGTLDFRTPSEEGGRPSEVFELIS